MDGNILKKAPASNIICLIHFFVQNVDHLLIAQRVLDEIRDKVNALESVLLEKSKNKSAGNFEEYSISNTDCKRN